MDKYEYNLKLEQMKSLSAEHDYQAAAQIADSINWHKIKNVNALVKAGEIYEKAGRYDDSKEILLMAYARSPIGRTIIYRLAEVSIKADNLEEAKDYYNQFVEMAPHDNLKYVLKYKISKAQEADNKTLIGILEELKEQEYSEEWAYELAYLYHQAGMGEKCVEACDELILWFGDGTYVERALALKMQYHQLNEQQAEKYRQFQQKKGMIEILPEDKLASGEIVSEPVKIPDVKVPPERFNTQNLQETLRKNIQQIMEATKKETVSDSMESIKKLVKDIPYLQIPVVKEKRKKAFGQQNETYDQTAVKEKLLPRSNFQEFLNEEDDGQISLFVPEQGGTESQILGQISIDDILEEQRAADTTQPETENRKLESAKVEALEEAKDIVERLADVIPKLDSGMDPKDVFGEQYLAGQPIEDDEAAEVVANLNLLLQQVIDRLSIENAQMDEQLAAASTRTETANPSAEKTAGNAVEELSREEVESPVEECDLPQIVMPEDLDFNMPEVQKTENHASALPMQTPKDETKPEQDFLARIDEALQMGHTGTEDLDKAGRESLPKISFLEEFYTKEVEKEKDAETSVWAEEYGKQKDDTQPFPKIADPELYEEEDIHDKLSKEQRAIFTYFVPIKGMEEQICRALTGVMRRLAAGGSASTGNLIIQGNEGSGKTVLATNILKALKNDIGKPEGRIGKIEAEMLNKRDMTALLNKVAGGCLIIEKAGDISKETAVKLSILMENDKSGLFLIIEDTKAGIGKALAKDASFASRFSQKISIPIFTSDELVVFAKSYANEQGYAIDEMGVLALYNCISNIQKSDHATTLAEVKDIVDDAIIRVEKGGLKKAFSIITSRRYDEDDYVILHEKDFDL